MQKLFHLILLFLLVLLSVGCRNNAPQYHIGVSQCSEDIWRDKLNREILMTNYVNSNVDIDIRSANDNSKKQIEQIKEFIREKVDLLIVSPNQSSSISPAIDSAYKAGIPVIMFDRKTNTDKYTAFIGADNLEIGLSMGKYIAEKLDGKGTVVEIMGLKGSSPAVDRHRGFMKIVASHPGIHVISLQGNWTEGNAYGLMKKLLKNHPHIDCVFGHNDRQAFGAYRVAKELGLDKKIMFVGVDGLPSRHGGIECVQKGIFSGTYIYPTRGTEVMRLAMAILEHKPYCRENLLKSFIVTKDNADMVMIQNQELERQGQNIDILHEKVSSYLKSYYNQKIILILCIVLVILLLVSLLSVYHLHITRLRMNEKKEAMAKVQLTFFTNVSHELRTPLTLIIDPLDRILANCHLKGKDLALLKLIERNVNVLMQLVNDILDFRKLQNGKMKLQLSRFNLVTEIRALLDEFRPSIEKKKVQVRFSSFPDNGFEMIGDRNKIGRIFTNLLSNALKYTSSNGCITVKVGKSNSNEAVFSVQDTGVGLEQEDLDRIFDRFYQTKDANGGTGIGLALVKDFIELHHGKINVTSKKNEGSTFTVILPVTQKGNLVGDAGTEEDTHLNEAELPNVPDQELKTEKRDLVTAGLGDEAPTILVIDDNDDLREYIKELLSEHYDVMEASDGKRGLELAREAIPDLVISDIMMPVMDGLEFCNRLKSDRTTSHIPVILLTARSMDDQRIEGYQNGADAYITKPFTSDLLLARIKNLLSSRILLRELFSGSKEETEKEYKLRNPDQQFVEQLRIIIKDMMGDSGLKVEQIAEKLGLSRVQLYRKVKALTGSTLVDLLRSARLEEGKHLLETTNKTISEIAYMVGFTAPSYFTTCFKEKYGYSPNETRQ
ncbi:substrate-binding domain-containing protein [Prevotella cerevisiae]|uniref:histidine kinase n=1 Tax=Segatella cerevisiae TaxID=2053716 RepID=A0ABT1BX49_9BACT|nr:substrate-binding domain-containing protein [Segatella cerevisiae]MCO6025650.1 substrate-binding domain-containing protein [Segatella cerevisiae]